MLLHNGIDTPQSAFALAVKLDSVATQAASARDGVRALGRVATTWAGEASRHSALIGLSVRFFDGIADPRSGRRSRPWRPSLDKPRCLQTMHARGDEHFPAVATRAAVWRCESDFLVLAEADDQAALEDLSQRLAHLCTQHSLLRSAEIAARVGHENRDPFGYAHGTSNLQDLRESDPEAYRRCVFIGDRQPRWSDDTYLVYRLYGLDLDRWSRQESQTRDAIIGRSAATGDFVSCSASTTSPAPADPALLVAPDAHIRQAHPRGIGFTQFGTTVAARPVRLLRRSYNVGDEHTGNGMLFCCFQGDIQRDGFEYVHNEWMMADGFMGGRDRLLDPAAGFVEPMDGCYYFVAAGTSLSSIADSIMSR